MSLAPIRRVVTGHDAHGDAVIATDDALPTVVELAAIPGTCPLWVSGLLSMILSLFRTAF